MKKVRFIFVLLINLILYIFLCYIKSSAQKNNWPQFRGVNGDGKSQETGLINKWSDSGPDILWRIPIGEGYSSVIAVDRYLYTMTSDTLSEFIVCLDQNNGQQVWKTRIGPLYESNSGNGSRSTPTYYKNNLFALGAHGHLMAVNAKNGSPLWLRNIQTEFNVQLKDNYRGYSMSPLIDGNLLFMDVGGGENECIIAFNIKSGETVWTAHTEDHPTYSTPLKIKFAGQEQVIFNAATHVVSVSPSGQIVWKFPWGKEHGNKIVNPLFIPPDKIFVSAIYDVGSSLLQMKNNKGIISINELWNIKDMQNHFTTSVLVGNYIYGFDVATFKCLDIETGKIKWAKRKLGRGSLIYADKKLIVLSEKGTLLLLQENSKAYKEMCSFRVFDHRVWTPPSLANGLLFLRSPKELVCINLKK